jgi:hypothetical protein
MIHSCSGPIPFHLQLWVDMLRFTNNGCGFVPAVWFGLNSTPGRMWGLHVMLECGAVYRNVPPHLVAFDDAPMEKLPWVQEDAQKWNCYGTDFSVVEYPYLADLTCRVKGRDWTMAGRYLFTAVPANDPFSRIPEQAKEFMFIRLDNGRLTIQPTDRVVFRESSFTTKTEFPKNLKTNDTIWRVEE